jgi:dTDP-4-amino-4,6-dideoxygalactose transaminase
VSLPMFAELREDQIEYIVDRIADFTARSARL